METLIQVVGLGFVGECQAANMNTYKIASAVLDLAHFGAPILRRQGPVLVLTLPVCPIDDGHGT